MREFEDIPTIYVGYDPREDLAFRVLKYSALKHAGGQLNVYPIRQDELRRIGLYRRAWMLGRSRLPEPDKSDDVWHRDRFDGRNFSTDFSFTRFLVPFLNRLEGWALFMDCDMYFRAVPLELFRKYRDPKRALLRQAPVRSDRGDQDVRQPADPLSEEELVERHAVELRPSGPQFPDRRRRKHEAGTWLHNFMWIEEQDIGALPEERNWFDGHSSASIDAKNVHFTRGGPWFRGEAWKPLTEQDEVCAQEWEVLQREMEGQRSVARRPARATTGCCLPCPCCFHKSRTGSLRRARTWHSPCPRPLFPPCKLANPVKRRLLMGTCRASLCAG